MVAVFYREKISPTTKEFFMSQLRIGDVRDLHCCGLAKYVGTDNCCGQITLEFHSFKHDQIVRIKPEDLEKQLKE